MPPSSLLLSTTLAYAKGAYTVALEFGSERNRANLLLDTGSSSLVVLPTAYDATRDRNLNATPWAQQVKYGQGSWAGPVLTSDLGLGEGIHARRLTSVPFALVQADVQNFRDYDGLFGLAFGGLNKVHDMSAVLAERAVSPALTWPWPFTLADSELDDFRKLLREQPTVALTPLFTTAEELDVVADKFAMLIRRSLAHVLDDDATPHALANDPLNRGMLVLGGGEEHQDLYEGPFRNVRIVHELYYNARLTAVQVGTQPRISAPPLDPDEVARAASNAIFDTGSTFLVLESSLYNAVRAGFAAHDPQLPALIDRFQAAFRQEGGLPNSTIDHRDWPDLHFYLESDDDEEVKLTCTPGDYWQRNALRAGQSYFLLMEQLPHWPKQSILGLPLLSGCYCIFDRRGTGVLRVAKAQDA
ncbi:MAG TPA: pepsin-like aspartic protease [Lysobacter sp.]|nr:pepsin-like aspartic protease [Lysobacter sp.]